MRKLKIIKFWVVSFAYIIYQCLRGYTWHMVYADFEVGKFDQFRPKRKRLIAQRTSRGCDLFWHDPTAWHQEQLKEARQGSK